MSDTTSERWPEFPEALRALFDGVWQETVSLHAKWELYLDLFGDPNRISVLNDSAPAVFQLVEECLRNDMTISFGRLTDPAKTGNKDNLSLAQLVDSLTPSCNKSMSDQLLDRLETLRDHCKSITQWRNRRVAHNDLATFLHYHPDPLPNIGQAYITDALAMLASLVNVIQVHFADGQTCYTRGSYRGNGQQLIYLLEQAREHRKRKTQSALARDEN